jgi:hypothetical protein
VSRNGIDRSGPVILNSIPPKKSRLQARVFCRYLVEHMSAVELTHEHHISLTTLWNYRMKRYLLSTEEMRHIARCDDCLALLGLCHISESIVELDLKLKDRTR